jgi:hypothetical protein
VAEEAKVCEVHGCPTIIRSVRVVYGLRGGLKTSLAYGCARRDLFPNCGDWVNRGCAVSDARTAQKAVCPECVAARDAYLAEHHPTWVASHDPASG